MDYRSYDLQKCLADIKKYDASPDRDAVEKLTRYLLPTIDNRDAQFVAVSDKQELDYIEEKWVEAKLGVSGKSAHEAVQHVAHQMKDAHNKSRMTFYYLVAKKLGKLHSIPG